MLKSVQVGMCNDNTSATVNIGEKEYYLTIENRSNSGVDALIFANQTEIREGQETEVQHRIATIYIEDGLCTIHAYNRANGFHNRVFAKPHLKDILTIVDKLFSDIEIDSYSFE